MAKFNDILAELRGDSQILQQEIADLLNVSPGTISNYETGKHMPSLDAVVRLADYFDVTTDYMLGRTGSRQSLGIMDTAYYGEFTVGHILQVLLKISHKSRPIIIEILDSFTFSDAVDRKTLFSDLRGHKE